MLLGEVGGVHTVGSPVTRNIVLTAGQLMELSLSPTLSTDWTKIAKAGENLTVNFKLDDNPGPQSFTKSLNLNAGHGVPKIIEAQPENRVGSKFEEKATVPFKLHVNVFDAKYNPASTYSGSLAIKFKLDPVYQPDLTAVTGIKDTTTLVDVIDHSTTAMTITNGYGLTGGQFTVKKVPNTAQNEVHPQILLGDVTAGYTLLNPARVTIVPGPIITDCP